MQCGKCHTTTEIVTRDHVFNCYFPAKSVQVALPAELLIPAPAAVAVIEAPVVQVVPQAIVTELVPASKYTVRVDGELRFYKVTAGTKNPNVRFLDQLIGAPGDWRKVKVSNWETRTKILGLIANDSYLDLGPDDAPFEEPVLLAGSQAAAVRYSREFTRCACCDASLSDLVSRTQGIGPICITRFAS